MANAPRSAAQSWLRRPEAWAVAATPLFILPALLPGNAFGEVPEAMLPLHLLVEFAKSAVAAQVFLIVWGSRRRRSGYYDFALGTAFLGAVLLGVGHTLSQVGMPAFITANSDEKAAVFWLSERLMTALVLLVYCLRRLGLRVYILRPLWLLLTVTGVSGIWFWLVLGHLTLLPRLLDDSDAPTTTALLINALIVAASGLAAWLLSGPARRGDNEGAGADWLAGGAWLIGMASFCALSDLGNLEVRELTEHLYQLCAYAMAYRALVVSLLERPYHLLDRERTLFRTLYNALPDGVWFKDTDGRYRLANTLALETLKVDENTLPNTSDYDYYPAEEAQLRIAEDQEALNSGAPLRLEREIPNPHGSPRTFEILKTPVYDELGEAMGVLGLARDITTRKQLMQTLRDNEARFRATANSAPVLIWDAAANGRLDWVNDPWLAFTGLNLDQQLTMGLMGGIHHDDRAAIEALLQQRLRTHEQFRCEYRLRHQDGSWRWVSNHAAPRYDERGRFCGFTGCCADITEQKQFVEHLRLWATIFENCEEGIMILDHEGVVLETNRAYSAVTGLGREESIGRNIADLHVIHQSQDQYPAIHQQLQETGHWQGEIWGRRRTGEAVVESVTISSICDEHGRRTHFLTLLSDITALKQQQQQLEYIAHFDPLTQLPNRVLLADRMRQAIAAAQRSGKLVAVCCMDLDGFKPINERYGHEAGDRLLIMVAEKVKDVLRADDSIARLGGDEFVVLFTGIEHMQHCEQLLGRIFDALSQPFSIGSCDVHISASVGVSLYPNDSTDADALLRQADQAMYLAKQSGRNRYHLFDAEQDRRTRARRDAIERMRIALERREFRLHYEPRVDMLRGRVLGFEALIRWQHPDRGLLPPGAFLPTIERTDFINTLGEWVITEALQQMQIWQRAGINLTVSINVAGRHLQSPHFASRLRELLSLYADVPSTRLMLEVLETEAIEDMALVSKIMDDCRALGPSFAIDDFGTGYSSLTYLRRLPAGVLKIDRTFVRDMLDDADDLALVEGIIGLARTFRREVVAEGVETARHGAMLLQLGCQIAQGYGIAKPMPPEQIPQWIATWRPDPLWAEQRNLGNVASL